MSQEDALLNQILSTPNAPRTLLLEYIKLISAKAKQLDKKYLLRTSGTDEYRAPTTPGEVIASSIQHVLLTQQAVSWKDDPQLATIEDIATKLTDQTDNEQLWEELFSKVEKLT